MSFDEEPINTLNAPGSNTQRFSFSLKNEKSSLSNKNSSSFVSPGSNSTLLKPFNSFCGLSTEQTGSFI